MRLPEEANRWRSDGRTIELDLSDLSINQLGELDGVEGDGTDQTLRFGEWLRSNGWTVITEHRGPMRIGGRAGHQDKSVAAFELMLLDEFMHSHCLY